eukprot:365394-Chlamydomonas_euryale.AAC.5
MECVHHAVVRGGWLPGILQLGCNQTKYIMAGAIVCRQMAGSSHVCNQWTCRMWQPHSIDAGSASSMPNKPYKYAAPAAAA